MRSLAAPTFAVALLLGASGCETEALATITVRVTTNYRAGSEFDEVRTELAEGESDASGPVARLQIWNVKASDDFAQGTEVAEFADVEPGNHVIAVRLLRRGTFVDEHAVIATVRGSITVPVSVTRVCTSHEDNCGDFRDDDCDGDTDCEDEDCFEQTCNGLCTEQGTCGATGNCEGGQPISCDDQNPCTDDSCDPARGCVHANNTNACNDGDACTEGDMCVGGSCGGTSVECDDGNACTADGCNPDSGCTHKNLDTECDDGAWCTGADRCDPGTGTCSLHPSPRCVGMPCSNKLMACVECGADADCGAQQIGAWTACGGFTDACDASGTQSRTVVTPRCVNNVCMTETAQQQQACVRGVPGEGGDCGGGGRYRCCGAICRDTFIDTSHCGGCNFACYPGQACFPTTKGVPACLCSNGFMCPSGVCRVGQPTDNNFCDCNSNAHCPAGKTCTEGSSGIDVCI
ncbi:MAG: hypothetical protein KC417_06965 [Myxococcales bacterium]|nr:hypothetical protein [Myxococcales bacterium]